MHHWARADDEVAPHRRDARTTSDPVDRLTNLLGPVRVDRLLAALVRGGHHWCVTDVAGGGTLPRQQLSFGILGPLEVKGGAGPLALRGRKQRALLGLLLLHVGEVVSSERLVDELWGEHPPATASSSLRNLVTQLRKLLGTDTVIGRPPGYLLQVEPERLDLTRFEHQLTRARQAQPRERTRLLREALELWRGAPLADLAYEHFAQAEIHRLEELRLEALEQRLEADLALGQGPELVPELEALVQAHPLRERLRGQLMLALYRAGRQADALQAYQKARQTLVDELGVEPSPGLRDLQASILRQEPALTARPQRRQITRLPAQPTTFVGRTRELAEVVALLQRADLRLLTLTGAGGSGKTRLGLRAATEVAADYPDGVSWVPLGSLRDPALVSARISQALAVNDEQDLADWIGRRRLLLLLDNCEHLLAAAPGLGQLLAACPNLKLFATSREPLHLVGEREYLVPMLHEQEAVALFCQRAHATEPESAVLAICRRLDCLPLAVELAAARTKLLPPDALLKRLERRLPLLTGGPSDAPERQRTLEATIAWSYDLLAESERTLFARLAVFAGGCTLDAAERVCEATVDTLQSLVDRNLLRAEGGRFALLETIREYAQERLKETSESEELRRRHADYFDCLARRSDAASTGDDLSARLNLIGDDHDNVRAALEWSLGGEAPELGASLALSLLDFWQIRGHFDEGRRWIGRALDTIRDDSQLEVRLLRAATILSGEDLDSAERLTMRRLELARENGDTKEISHCLNNLGVVAEGRREFGRARELYEESLVLAREVGLPPDGLLHGNLARVAFEEGRVDEARQLVDESMAIARDLGDDHQIFARVIQLIDMDLDRGSAESAETRVQEVVEMAKTLQYKGGFFQCAVRLAAILAAKSDVVRAAQLLGKAEVLLAELGLTIEGPLLEDTRARVRAELGEEAWIRATKAGRDSDVEELLDDAVQSVRC